MPRRESSNSEDEAAFRRRFQEVREALALLVAVEHADNDAYDHILTEKCGVYHGRYGEEVSEVSIAVKFMLDVDEEGHEIHGDAADGIEYDLVRLCGTDQREHPSEGYLTALSQIAALDDNLKSGEAGVDITIPVKVDFCAKFAENVAGTLNYANKLRDIARAEKTVDAQWETSGRSREDELDSGAIRCTFVLAPMSANTGLMDLTRDLAETLERLVADNVWFSFLDLPVSFQREGLSELEARKALRQLLRRVLDSTCRSQEDAHINYYFDAGATRRGSTQECGSSQLAAVNLACEPTMPSRDFEAMCSAMVVAQTTEKLTLELEFETLDRQTRELWWKWLAYALFSRRARAYSSVKTLTLVGIYRLSAADVRAFNSILTAEHPEETLFGTPRGRVDERDATLKSGSPIRWEFDGEGQPVLGSHDLTFDEPIPFARTFSDDGESEWVHVLVPGFGHCQVQRTNLDFPCVSTPNASSSGITSLAIFFYVDGMTGVEGLVPFIESVGSSLTSLVLDGPKSAHLQDMDENAIIRSCPNLQEVTFSRQLVEVQLDLSEYRAKNTPIPDLTFKWSDVTEFAEQLRDASDPLTKCVRYLRFSLLSRWVPEEVLMAGTAPNFEFYVNAIIKMLEENERLEYLEVRSPYYNYVKDFKKFHLKPIHRQRKPLARKCMLAFLSVLASRTPSTTDGQEEKG